MKVDNLAEERVDFQVGTGDSFEVTERNNWQATRNYQSCNTATSEYIINKKTRSSCLTSADVLRLITGNQVAQLSFHLNICRLVMVMLCSIISRFVFVRARVMSVKLSCFLSCFCCVLRVISVGK